MNFTWFLNAGITCNSKEKQKGNLLLRIKLEVAVFEGLFSQPRCSALCGQAFTPVRVELI